MVTMGFFWMCLCPHLHLKPIILSLWTISSQLLALQFVFCLWNFQRVSASSLVNGTVRFADNKNHAIAKARLNHIAGINTPDVSRDSTICSMSFTLQYDWLLQKCEKTHLTYMNLKYGCSHACTVIFLTHILWTECIFSLIYVRLCGERSQIHSD